MPKIGAVIATNTMPAASAFILCVTTGIGMNMRRVTAAMNAGLTVTMKDRMAATVAKTIAMEAGVATDSPDSDFS